MRKLNQKGSLLILLTLGFALLAVFVGFAVDFGRAYVIKARIARLVDAAALVAAKELKGQVGFENEATRAACDSMAMNGAPVVMTGPGTCAATSGAPFTVAVTFFDAPVAGGPPIRHVNVTGTEPMTTTFLRFLGFMAPGSYSTINIAAAAEAGPERPVDLMLVLDRSGSMNEWVGSQSKLNHLKTAVDAFLSNNFTGNDRVGMISFSDRGCGNASGGNFTGITCVPDVPLTDATEGNITMLKNRVWALVGGGLTNTMETLRTARPVMAAVFTDPTRALSRKAVLLVTDGKPTALRRDNDEQCRRNPKTNDVVPGWDTGSFPDGCLQSASANGGDRAGRLTLSVGGNVTDFDSELFRNVVSCGRSLSSCNAGTNGAMYEANLLRNCGTGNSSCSPSGAHDVLVFAIGIGALSSTPNASFDNNAKCMLARIANATDILNTGTSTVETMTSVCSSTFTTTDNDSYPELQDGCSGACTINASQEKGKVYVVDTNGDVPAQLQLVFREIAALLKLRLTL